MPFGFFGLGDGVVVEGFPIGVEGVVEGLAFRGGWVGF